MSELFPSLEKDQIGYCSLLKIFHLQQHEHLLKHADVSPIRHKAKYEMVFLSALATIERQAFSVSDDAIQFRFASTAIDLIIL